MSYRANKIIKQSQREGLTLDPTPWVFAYIKRGGFLRAPYKMSDYYSWSPRLGYEQDRSKYEH